MAKSNVAGELYETLTGQLFEIGRQLRQPNGYPFDPFKLKRHLQAAIEGNFGPGGEIYQLKLGGNTTTDQITASLKEGGFTYVNESITQEYFPLTPHNPEEIEIEVIDPGHSFYEAEGLKLLEAGGLARPTIEQALRFVEQFGTTTTGNKPFVIFLHESWRGPGSLRRILYVDREPSRRGLNLRYPDSKFSIDCVLAGVRPHKSRLVAEGQA